MFVKSMLGIGQRSVVEIEPCMHRIFRLLKGVGLMVSHDCTYDIGGVFRLAYV
jgi:hypothetical protein